MQDHATKKTDQSDRVGVLFGATMHRQRSRKTRN